MRRWLVVLALLGGLVAQARADDFDLPTLRGSEPFAPAPPSYRNWSGFYVGGDLSRNSALMDFSKATQSLATFSLRNTTLANETDITLWQVLNKPSISKMGFGGFAGYNSQWDDVVLSLELGYNRTSLSAIPTAFPISRVTSAGNNAYAATLTGSGSMQMLDYATLRARAGWNIGNFLPYVTAGAAVGRMNFSRSVHIFGQENPPSDGTPCAANPTCVPFSFTNSETKNGAIAFGWALGGGIDVMVMPNAFLRAEYEFVKFAPISGIVASINSGRLGAGVKF